MDQDKTAPVLIVLCCHPGINKKRTLRETEELLKQYDGGGFQWVVRATNWLKPKGE
jgi:hypothetical protein